MAITRLLHMKESPGCAHEHLRNAIDYILDVKHGGVKTDYGKWVGGNSGLDHKEILSNFLETKRDFGKLDGRQGYHFEISFAPGETDVQTAYDVVREWCEEYLGDNYDYVFAIHTDKHHLHGHIIFNSINRIDGYKYHYKKGDWQKYIQPVTDRICVDHHLSPLKFEEKRVGKSYAKWAEDEKGMYNPATIIRADVDYAIQRASSFEEFVDMMKQMSYQLKFGSSKTKGNYITYMFPKADGQYYRRRSYKLPPGYSPEEISKRIQTKNGSRTYEEIVEHLTSKASESMSMTMLKSTQTYRRMYQAVSYYKLPNPFAVPAARVRHDILRIDKLIEECRYLKEKNITERNKLDERMAAVFEKINRIQTERKTLYKLLDQVGSEYKAQMEQYHMLQKAMVEAEREGSDRFEEIEDKMEELSEQLPHELLEINDRIADESRELSELRKERRILTRLLQTEDQDWNNPSLQKKIQK